MIIKGGSRGGPDQLARHLQRADTNERVQIVSVDWGTQNLREAFLDWQLLAEGTRGWKGLYHVNIDPAKNYAMTPEQWNRCVQVLEKELGFEGQPRAIVLHQKHGRQHLHVVWARTDIDTMTLRSDSMNYLAHERASKALELEFGHEIVPGKHAKRDRAKQPEFPRAEMTHAEWQQAERAAMTAAERKHQVTELHRGSDSGLAFKAALEESGYVLAKGDKRDFVLVDSAGDAFSLGRQIAGMKAGTLRAFMADIDRAALPTVEEAAEIQRRHREALAERRKDAATGPSPIETIQDEIHERQRREEEKWRAVHGQELSRAEFDLEQLNRQKIDDRLAENKQEMADLKERIRQENSGIRGFIEAVQARLNPVLGAEKAQQRRREIAQMKRRQQREMKDWLALLEQTKQQELENLKERQAQQLRDLAAKGQEEIERRVRERENEQRLRAELEAERRREAERAREGPDPPSRVR